MTLGITTHLIWNPGCNCSNHQIKPQLRPGWVILGTWIIILHCYFQSSSWNYVGLDTFKYTIKHEKWINSKCSWLWNDSPFLSIKPFDDVSRSEVHISIKSQAICNQVNDKEFNQMICIIRRGKYRRTILKYYIE